MTGELRPDEAASRWQREVGSVSSASWRAAVEAKAADYGVHGRRRRFGRVRVAAWDARRWLALKIDPTLTDR